MELRQLEHFPAIVDEGSFTAAAGRLYMVQSGLLASLLGWSAHWVRSCSSAADPGPSSPTPGRRSSNLLGQRSRRPTDRARDAVAEVKRLVRGTVRIACVLVPERVDVIETIQEFQEGPPGVRVRVMHDGARHLAGAVADGQFDLAVTRLMHRPGPAVRFALLVATPLVLLRPRGLDGTFIRVNKAHELLVGRTSDELAHLRVANVTHPDDRCQDAVDLAQARGQRSGP